jgi:hypothetical protein
MFFQLFFFKILKRSCIQLDCGIVGRANWRHCAALCAFISKFNSSPAPRAEKDWPPNHLIAETDPCATSGMPEGGQGPLRKPTAHCLKMQSLLYAVVSADSADCAVPTNPRNENRLTGCLFPPRGCASIHLSRPCQHLFSWTHPVNTRIRCMVRWIHQVSTTVL